MKLREQRGLCKMCHKRPAVFQRRKIGLAVKRDKDHDLCRQCHESVRDAAWAAMVKANMEAQCRTSCSDLNPDTNIWQVEDMDALEYPGFKDLTPGWYFINEVEQFVGPYSSRQEALDALSIYAKQL